MLDEEANSDGNSEKSNSCENRDKDKSSGNPNCNNTAQHSDVSGPGNPIFYLNLVKGVVQVIPYST